jgi:hypothetical protein
MALPKIDRRNLRKPLCYDPRRKKFITFREITTGKEKIVPLEKLSQEEMKMLVVERQLKGPDYTMQAISGMPYTRDDVVKSILKEDEVGQMTMEAELSMLKELLHQIEKNLPEK